MKEIFTIHEIDERGKRIIDLTIDEFCARPIYSLFQKVQYLISSSDDSFYPPLNDFYDENSRL